MGPRRLRLASGELRRLRLGPANGGVHGGGLGSDGGGVAAGSALPQGRRWPYPPDAARAGPDRGGDRARAEHLLLHRPRSGGGNPPPCEAPRPARQGRRDRRVESFSQEPGAELPRPGARRGDRPVGAPVPGRRGSGRRWCRPRRSNARTGRSITRYAAPVEGDDHPLAGPRSSSRWPRSGPPRTVCGVSWSRIVGWSDRPDLFTTWGERNGYAEAMLAKSEIQREALNLSAPERIELVVELWDSLAPG